MATAPEKRLWEQGSVVWAKIAGRPWWPCVVFSSWEVRSRRPRRGARRPCAAKKCTANRPRRSSRSGTCPSTSRTGRPSAPSRRAAAPPPRPRAPDAAAPSQVVGCFLVNYTLQVFDERGPSIRGWDQVAAQDVLDELRLDPISRGLRRAVDDARQLISLHAGGELDAAPGEAPGLADARDWVDCLASLESASTKHGDDVRGVVARAAALARDAGEPAALERILACLRPDFDAGVCRLEALSLVEDETGDDYLGAASRAYLAGRRAAAAAAPPPAPAVFDGAESDGDDDGARASLRDILADPRTKLSPGPLSLDLAGDGVARAALTADGRIAFRGAFFDDVDAFVSAARASGGRRAPRATQAGRKTSRPRRPRRRAT